MKKLIRGLFWGSTGIFALALTFVAGIGFLAAQREQAHELDARLFLSEFPNQAANATAVSLDEILIDLDLPPVLAESAIAFKDPHSPTILNSVFDYTRQQATRQQGPLDAIPVPIQQYLAKHEASLDQAEDLLLKQSLPDWGVDIEAFANLEIRELVFVGVVNLHRLLLLRSWQANQQGDLDRMERSLTAAWQLTQAMAERPNSTSQLATNIQVTNQLAFLRHLEGVSPTWLDRISRQNYQSRMVRSLQFDSWITYKSLQKNLPTPSVSPLTSDLTPSLPESYWRLSTVNMSQHLNHFYTELAQQTPCHLDTTNQALAAAWWNRLVLLGLPKSTRQWQRSGETMLAIELTQRVLSTKALASQQARWPEKLENQASQACTGAYWQYQVTPDNRMSITFQGPIGWRNEQNHGSSLNYQTPDGLTLED